MTIREEILTIANQLANQGKSPSVALIKTKLTAPAPLPVIISTLKTWQHDPDYTSLKKTEDKKESAGEDNNRLEQEIEQAIKTAVQEAIAPLQNELAEIKALLLSKSRKK